MQGSLSTPRPKDRKIRHPERMTPHSEAKETWDLRKTDTGWAFVKTSPPLVPATQPPPDDMPPITLMVLDALADDIETVDTMRLYGDGGPNGLALVGENHIFDALRELLADGLIHASEMKRRDFRGVAVPEPRTDDEHLRHYWFGMTEAGKAEWERGQDVLDKYWDEHPI
jgi:hypothetical protein